MIERTDTGFRLIEFKRDVDSIKDEDKKYGDGKTSYIDACNGLTKLNGRVSHHLIFGSIDKNNQLQLHCRKCLATDGNDVLSASTDLATVKFAEFNDYITELGELRGWQGSSSAGGGLVLADVGDGQVTILALDEFIQLVPSLSLSEKFSPAETLSATGLNM